MTATTKRETINARAVGYYSGFGGIEVKRILYGIEDRVIFTAGAWTGKPSAHSARIYTTLNGRAYFNYRGCRIHFDEVLRV